MAPPKPDSAQLQHPRRLLMADLETHLMHYALDPNCTLVLMGDMNIGFCTRKNDDGPALRLMMTRLGLISCAEARWPDSHRGFLTHRAGEGQAHSHIDYILITEPQAASVRWFGIDADGTLMHDFGHAVLFADVDVVKVLGLAPVEEVTTPKRRRSGYATVTSKGWSAFGRSQSSCTRNGGLKHKCKTSLVTSSWTIVCDSKARTAGRNGRGAAGTQCIGGMARAVLMTCEAFVGELTKQWPC